MFYSGSSGDDALFNSQDKSQRVAAIRRDPSPPKFTTALFTIGKRWEQPKSPLTHEWINKMWSIHIMECYLALKRKEILSHTVIWTSVEDIILSEISQSKRTHTLGSKIQRDGKWNGGCRGAGGEEKEVCV